jgi:hypothetical protein
MKSVFRAVLALTLLLSTVLVSASPAMAANGSVSGTVTGSGTGGLPNITVELTNTSGTPIGKSAPTDASGNYTITDVVPGDYKVRARDLNVEAGAGQDWVSEFYNNVQNQASATVVNVGDGEAQGNIDFVLAKGGRIEGTVTDSDGDPVSQICVSVYDQQLRLKGFSKTRTDGTYTVATVAAGAVVLRFHDCTAPFDFGPEWYNNKLTGLEANTVTVTAGGQVTGVNAQLGEGFTLTGTVTEELTGNEANGACVTVYNVGGSKIDSDNANSSGVFVITGLDPQEYEMRISDCTDGQPRWKTEWWENASTRDGADEVDLSTGGPAGGFNPVVTPIGDIKGKVTKQSGGGSLSGVKVRAYQGNTVVKSIETGGNGKYKLNDIPKGTYDIKFTKSGYTTEWYNGDTVRASANEVTLSRGEVETGINASMQKTGSGGGGGGGGAGSIAGTVTSITGGAVSGAKVEVYKTSGSLVKSATTSSSGTYKVSGLADGTYLVLFANGSASYFTDWYTSAPLYREADATKVTVNGAETGKNGNLQPIFSDIAGNTFYSDIIWLRNTGITLGCDDTHFCPSSSVTRGQMAAFLVRGLDLTGDTSGDTFSDDNDSTFEDEIEILAQNGVTLGCDDGLFCPEASVTRGQMAAFLVRAMGYDYNPPGDRFTDDNGSTFEDEIEKLAEAGVTQGCTDTLFCPNDPVTRGQMAAFLHRALGGGEIYPG